MKVFVIGAHGEIGHQVVEKLQVAREYEAVAMVRKEEQLKALKKAGVTTVLGNLEDSIDALAQAAEGAQAMVFAAGSGGKTGADKTILVDLNGAVKAVEAAKKAGIKRFIIVSAIGAQQWLEPHPSWLDQLDAYYAAKFYADEWIKNSDLDYTIIRPGTLTNDQPTGKVTLAETLEHPASISRTDVAELIVSALAEPKTIQRSFDVVNGPVKIATALNQL